MPISAAGLRKVESQAAQFEGMLMPLDLALYCWILGYQPRNEILGDLAEFGVYRGKSAAVFLHYLREGEFLRMVEYESSLPEVEKLTAICDRFTFAWGRSEDQVESADFLSQFGNGLRFSNHDASHSFDNVTNELRFVESNLSKFGVAVLDDFCNMHYSQVQAAYYQYKARSDSDLEIFLISGNKAWLCRKEAFSFYENAILSSLTPTLSKAGMSTSISRTDSTIDHRAIFVSAKSDPGEPDRFGEQIYAEHYKPSPSSYVK